MKLYVGNLPFTASEQDVQDLFAEAGAVETVQIMRDQATGRPRGFGFVTMVDAAGGQAAIAKLDQQPFQGRNLTVNEARPQVKREGGFGGGGGGGGKFGGGGGGRNRREPRW
jgi:RNA recognition motif-containing protein